MKKIIKKAIEGGYKPSEMYLEETAYGADYQFHAIFTDPLFWQALGKACGWVGFGYRKTEEYEGHEERIERAMTFHELNITQGWNEAVKWLEELVVKE